MEETVYSAFTKATASGAAQPETTFAALCVLTQQLVGVKLFTILTHDDDTGVAQRIYTNMPDAYPVGGAKPMDETDWSRQVIVERQTFVANDIDAIAEVFPDYELISSLGCASVINVPIIVAGKVKGTINCLHEEGYYTPERVAASEVLKLPGAVSLMLHELGITSDR